MSKNALSSPAAYGQPDTPGRRPGTTEDRPLAIDGIRTKIHRFGTGTVHEGGGGIVALHGFTGDGRDFAPLAGGAKTRLPLPWLAPDLPGHGACRVDDPARGYSFEAVDALIEATLQRLPPGPRRLLGYSMGGRLALHFAVRNPGAVDQLLLIGASPGIETAREREERHANELLLATRIERDGLTWFAPYWENQPVIRSQETIRPTWLGPMRRRRRRLDPVSLAHSLRNLGTGAMPPLWNRLHSLRMPAVLFVGTQDTKFLNIADEMRRRCPSLLLSTIPGAGHCAHLENPRAFLDAFHEHARMEQRGADTFEKRHN